MPVQRKTVRKKPVAPAARVVTAGASVPAPVGSVLPVRDLLAQDLIDALAGIDVVVPPDKLAKPSMCMLSVRAMYDPVLGAAIEFDGVPVVSGISSRVDFPGADAIEIINPLTPESEILRIWLPGGKLYVFDIAVRSKRAGTWFHLHRTEDSKESIEATGEVQNIIRGLDLRQQGTTTYAIMTFYHDGRKTFTSSSSRPFEFFHCQVTAIT